MRAYGSSNINIDNIREAMEPENEPLRTIKASCLERVAGGLYRVRDDYDSVWRKHEAEDGTNYIIRVGGDDHDADILKVDFADDLEDRRAYKMEKQGVVYIVWDCRQCDAANVTKEGVAVS